MFWFSCNFWRNVFQLQFGWEALYNILLSRTSSINSIMFPYYVLKGAVDVLSNKMVLVILRCNGRFYYSKTLAHTAIWFVFIGLGLGYLENRSLANSNKGKEKQGQMCKFAWVPCSFCSLCSLLVTGSSFGLSRIHNCHVSVFALRW